MMRGERKADPRAWLPYSMDRVVGTKPCLYNSLHSKSRVYDKTAVAIEQHRKEEERGARKAKSTTSKACSNAYLEYEYVL